jgi:hypothetical protein
MTNTLRLLSLTSLLVTGFATATLAANTESPAGNQSMTGTQTPATGNSGTAGAYGTNNQSAQGYPSGMGPTGSKQPDATNPNRMAPRGEGGSSGGGNSAASGGSSSTR